MRINWKSYLLIIFTAFLLAGCPSSRLFHDESHEGGERHSESHEGGERHSENHGMFGDDDD